MVRDLRFVFLGTGTSAGVPAIACECPVCTSRDPRDTRLRCGAAVRFTDATGHERVVLIDATPDLRQQALRHRLTRCDAILFTHNHVDHTFGLDEVRRFNAVQRAPIDIYAEDHTLAHLRRVYQHVFEADKNINDSFVAHLIAHRLDGRTPVDVHGVRFAPIRLLHGKLPILGFRIEPADARGHAPGFPLAYCTDVSAIPPESWPLLTRLQTLVLDGLRHRKHPTHLSIPEAVEIAHRIGAPRTFLTHIAHEVSHAQTEDDLPEAIHLAHDGLTIGGEAGVVTRSADQRTD